MLSDNGFIVATTTRNEPVLGRFHQSIAPTQITMAVCFYSSQR